MPMREVKGSIFQMLDKCLHNNTVAWIVVPTNSYVKANEGVAFPPVILKAIPWVEFKTQNGNNWGGKTMRTNLRRRLAYLHKTDPNQWLNHLVPLGKYEGKLIVGLPHKLNDWRASEDISLILRECQTIIEKCNKLKFKAIAMLRPVSDDSKWTILKPQLEKLFAKTDTVIGVFDGIAHNPTIEPEEQEAINNEPKEPTQLELKVEQPMKLKDFKDLSDEEKKAKRKEWAAKAAATRKRNIDVKRIEAELGDLKKELE